MLSKIAFSPSLPYCPAPAVYRPYYLGWDATAWAAPPNGSVCIHHPAGDTKAIAYTSAPLQRAQYLIRQPTHYQVVWREGAMETGSSGGGQQHSSVFFQNWRRCM